MQCEVTVYNALVDSIYESIRMSARLRDKLLDAQRAADNYQPLRHQGFLLAVAVEQLEEIQRDIQAMHRECTEENDDEPPFIGGDDDDGA